MRRVARVRLAAHTQADGEARALGGGDGGGDLLERVRLESDLQNDRRGRSGRHAAAEGHGLHADHHQAAEDACRLGAEPVETNARGEQREHAERVRRVEARPALEGARNGAHERIRNECARRQRAHPRRRPAKRRLEEIVAHHRHERADGAGGDGVQHIPFDHPRRRANQPPHVLLPALRAAAIRRQHEPGGDTTRSPASRLARRRGRRAASPRSTRGGPRSTTGWRRTARRR